MQPLNASYYFFLLALKLSQLYKANAPQMQAKVTARSIENSSPYKVTAKVNMILGPRY
jgi:hypothetical protein